MSACKTENANKMNEHFFLSNIIFHISDHRNINQLKGNFEA